MTSSLKTTKYIVMIRMNRKSIIVNRMIYSSCR